MAEFPTQPVDMTPRPHIWMPPTLPADHAERLGTVVAAYLGLNWATTPALLLDRERLRFAVRRWRHRLPTVTPYYAVKANVDPIVLRELFACGARADVASEFEIETCLSVGLRGEQMIVSNPRKDRDTIRALKRVQAFATVVDSEAEVDRLVSEGVPGPECEPVLFVRVKVPTRGVTQDLSSKFGVRVLPKGTDPFARPLPPPDLTAVRALLRHARAAGFRRFGLSTHVGTQCADPAVYGSALEVLATVAERALADGFSIGHIDLGGGFADARSLAAAGTNADDLLAGVAAAIAQWTGPPVRFLAEPGRTLVADAGALLTQVIYDRDTDSTGRRVQIDDGVFRTLSGRIHDDKTYRFLAMRMGGQPFLGVVCPMVVWGCSCDSFDRVSDDVTLPADLTVGDYLVADTLGAYSTSFGSNTNGFQPARPVLYWEEDGKFRFTVSPMADQNALMLAHIRRWAAKLDGEP